MHDGTFPSPRIVAYAERISHNLELMKAWSAAHHVQIAPHAKTTMSASLVRRQLAAGAWGVTAATAVQAKALHARGAQRIILANQLVSPAGIEWARQACFDDVADILLPRALDAQGQVVIRSGFHGRCAAIRIRVKRMLLRLTG